MILLQAHMSSLRYHPLLAAFFGINAATISPLAGSELQGVRFTLRASAREREREKEKEKKAHNNAHTASQAMDVLPLGNAGASARCTSLPDVDGGAPAATPYTPRHTLHISKILPNSGRNRSPTIQPSIHGLCMGVCAQYTGSRNGLAHALQDSIVGSDSGTPKLPRSTVPVLRSTVPA